MCYWRLPLVKISARANNIWESKGPKNPKRGNFIDAESIRRTFKTFNFTSIFAILMKLTTDIYLGQVFYLAKSWGVTRRVKESVNKKNLKMSRKIIIFCPISTISSYFSKSHSISSDASSCTHHWSKFQTKLTTFWGVLAEKLPKSTLNWQFLLVQKHLKIWNSRTSDLISIKLACYVYQLNTFNLLKSDSVQWKDDRVHTQKTINKCQKFLKILTLTRFILEKRTRVR